MVDPSRRSAPKQYTCVCVYCIYVVFISVIHLSTYVAHYAALLLKPTGFNYQGLCVTIAVYTMATIKARSTRHGRRKPPLLCRVLLPLDIQMPGHIECFTSLWKASARSIELIMVSLVATVRRHVTKNHLWWSAMTDTCKQFRKIKELHQKSLCKSFSCCVCSSGMYRNRHYPE